MVIGFAGGVSGAAIAQPNPVPPPGGVAVAAGATATPAMAMQPVIAPAPAWVKTVAIPSLPATASEAAFTLLLQDQQVLIEADRQTLFVQSAIAIQAPQGLAAGNISLPWRPETDVLTVHRIEIVRGGARIDVLASGQTFTVLRREQNLENAVLDGMLTASIQPEGLQVGDVLLVSFSLASRDPVLKGHAEFAGAAWNMVPIMRAHMSVQWPDAISLRIGQTPTLPPLRPVRRGGTSRVELSLDGIDPLPAPRGAPGRFAIGRMAEFSDFASWADVAALMAPLYTAAAVIPADGPLRAEVTRIRALSPDPIVRAEAALALVQDRVRYVALAMGQGALTPADAATTWSRRFGDCKGKTALLVAILHALNIQAEPVLVNSTFGDGLDQRLPMVGMFDHVLVRATIAGKAYWLDGTRIGDTRLAGIAVPAFGWGLPVTPAGATLVRMMPAPPEQPLESTSIRIDATAGIAVPAPTRVEVILRGDGAVSSNMSLANLAPDARERTLREYWRGRYQFIDIVSTSSVFDPIKREQRLVLEGKANMDWAGGRYETDGVGVGYRADFRRDPGRDVDAPFAMTYPYHEAASETILLPPGAGMFRIQSGEDVDQTVGGIHYRRRARLIGNVFTVERSARSVAPEFPAAAAPAAQAALRALADRTVYVVKAGGAARAVAGGAGLSSAGTPADAAGFVRRAMLAMEGSDLDAALADFTRAITLDPRNVAALTGRSSVYIARGDFTAGKRDLDAAAAIDSNSGPVLMTSAVLAQETGRPREAIDAYTRTLAIWPDNSEAIARRADMYQVLGDDERALSESAGALRRDPRMPNVYLMRANIFRRRDATTAMIAEAAALIAAMPSNAYARVVAARIYASADRMTEATREFDAALAIEQEPYIYVNRALARRRDDVAGKLADLEAALRLDPNDRDALLMKVELAEMSGDRDGAIAALTIMLRAHPTDVNGLAARGSYYWLAGKTALAEADFSAARANVTIGGQLNDLCYRKAARGIALQIALAECEEGLRRDIVTASYLDSRAFVLLRLGRYDEAIEAYNRTLAMDPRLAPALLGRAITWARKGDKAKSDADLAAALAINPKVQDEFRKYPAPIGIERP